MTRIQPIIVLSERDGGCKTKLDPVIMLVILVFEIVLSCG